MAKGLEKSPVSAAVNGYLIRIKESLKSGERRGFTLSSALYMLFRKHVRAQASTALPTNGYQKPLYLPFIQIRLTAVIFNVFTFISHPLF